MLEEKMKGNVLLFFVTATVLLSRIDAQPGIRDDIDPSANLTDGESPTTGLPLPPEVTNTAVVEESRLMSHPTACIRSLVDLRQAFLDLKTAPGSKPEENTIFSFHPIQAVRYTSLALFYDYSTLKEGNQPASFSNSSNSTMCCNPENPSSCIVFFRHHSYLYRAIYAPLIFLYAFPTMPNKIGSSKWFNKRIRNLGVHKLCWKVPPFCTQSERIGGHNERQLLKAFTAEVKNLSQYIHCKIIVYFSLFTLVEVLDHNYSNVSAAVSYLC